MPYVEFFSLLVTLLGMFFWNRSESRADIRHMDAKLEANRQETTAILKGIQQEIKDFHGRLEKQDAEFKSHMLHLHGKA